MALGASRARLFRERLVDGVVIAAAGAGGGIVIAYGVVAAIARSQEQFLGRMEPVVLDASALLGGAVAGLLAGVMAVLVPHGTITTRRLAESLRGTRGTAGDATSTSLRSSLVVVQVALALVLIVGAGLLARTVRNLATTALGFSTAEVTLTQLTLPGTRYASAAQQIQFERDVLAELRRIPGVADATASVGFPIIGGMMAGLTIFGAPPDQAIAEVAYMSIAPNLLSVLGIPLTEGRGLTDRDTDAAPDVFVINEMMARTYWPRGDALGARVYVGPGGPETDDEWATVVGIVPDIRQHGPTEPVRPTAYGSTLQFSWPRRHFAVRSEGAPAASLPAAIRAAVRAVDPGLAVGPIMPVDAQVAMRTARHGLAMAVLTFFGFVALVLCGFGLYAVVALTSQLRRREYAIRLALGAPRQDVRWMVVRQAMLLAVCGAAAGIAIAAMSTRALQGMLHGVEPVDAATFAAACGIVLTIAAVSAWMPARRAGRVDPVEALKAE
jgi:predicted permease